MIQLVNDEGMAQKSRLNVKTNVDAVDNEAKSNECKNQNVGIGPDQGQIGKETTRSKMAILFILGFFAILFLCVVYAIWQNAAIGDLKDILVAIIGALSGTLGFIVGYYYKSEQEK